MTKKLLVSKNIFCHINNTFYKIPIRIIITVSEHFVLFSLLSSFSIIQSLFKLELFIFPSFPSSSFSSSSKSESGSSPGSVLPKDSLSDGGISPGSVSQSEGGISPGSVKISSSSLFSSSLLFKIGVSLILKIKKIFLKFFFKI